MTNPMKKALDIIKQDADEKRNEEESSITQETILRAVKHYVESETNLSNELRDDLVNAISNIKIEQPNIVIPEIKAPVIPEFNIPAPQVTVNVPDVIIPEIKVPEAHVTVDIPEIKVPTPQVTVNVPDINVPTPQVNMPDSMQVYGNVGLEGVDSKRPLPVMMMGADGKPAQIGGGGSSAKIVKISNIPTDESTSAVMTIEYAHHAIHEGNHYYVNVYDADVDTLAPKYIRITTPVGTQAHLIEKYESTGAGVWQFYENPTINAAGTGLTEINNNRNSTNTATCTAFEDTTTTNDGTLLWTDRTGADGVGGTDIPGGSTREMELILKENEDYILKFTPDANDAKIVVTMSWYEQKT